MKKIGLMFCLVALCLVMLLAISPAFADSYGVTKTQDSKYAVTWYATRATKTGTAEVVWQTNVVTKAQLDDLKTAIDTATAS